MNPKVYLCHESEDKDRFVSKFSSKLREREIDPLLDKWQMFPEESLLDKILEEGLKGADALILVLSYNSVDKSWLKDDLDAAMVNRISQKTKIIPIVLDKCVIPKQLQSSLTENIDNLNDYPNNLNRIVNSIFSNTDGSRSIENHSSVNSGIAKIAGLVKTDNLVLKLSCEYALKTNNRTMNSLGLYFENELSINSEEDLLESLGILDSEGYIKLTKTGIKDFVHYKVTSYGFEKYATTYIKNYQNIQSNMISLLVNEKLISNIELAENLNQAQLTINHILEIFEQNGHLNLAKIEGGLIRVFNISPKLKRSIS